MIKCFFFIIGISISFNAISTQLTYTENNTSNDDFRALGYPVPLPVNSQTPVAGFRSYASLHARHQFMALDSALISSRTIGESRSGEAIWGYVLSDDNATTFEGNIGEASFLQNGGIHAREWQSPEVVTGIMERFYNNQADEGFYQYLLENNQLIIIPVLNVDGFLQTQRYPENAIFSTDQDDFSQTPRDGRMRRKNMLDVDTDLSTENDFLSGVDLNRNNNPYWASTSNRSSSRIESIVHHGAGPASEPETQALQAAAELANGSLRFYIDTHSFTKIYFTPMTGSQRRDQVTARVADKMRAVNNNTYAYGPASEGAGIGATDEYFAETYQIPSYTLETEPGNAGATDYGGFGVSHDGFILPEAEIERVRNELANASILGYYMQAGPASVIAVEITQIDDNRAVFSGSWQAQSATSRNWQNPTNEPLVAATDYRLKISFNKVMRWQANGELAQYPGLSTALVPDIKLGGSDANGASFELTLNTASGDWPNQTGSENNGYQRYQSDSFVVDFILDTNSPVIGANLLELSIDAFDLAGSAIDANPATAAYWQEGRWCNYESIDGTLEDQGGIDRQVRLVDDGSAKMSNAGGCGGKPSSGSSGSGSGGTATDNSTSGGGAVSTFALIWLGLISFLSRLKKPGHSESHSDRLVLLLVLISKGSILQSVNVKI